MGVGSVPANFQNCRAYSGSHGYCLSVLQSNVVNRDGTVTKKYRCTMVYYSAACFCDTATLKASGSCTYYNE